MNIIFFGSDEISVYPYRSIIESGINVKALITTEEKPKGRGLKPSSSQIKVVAQNYGIDVLQPKKLKENEEILKILKNLNPDLGVVVAYGKIIPKEIIDIPKHGIINLHFSLLPQLRGAAPLNWAIINGMEKTGATVFFINEKMDEGDIIIQKEIEIGKRERVDQLRERIIPFGTQLLLDAIKAIEIGNYKRIPQDNSLATHAPKIKKEDGFINWTKSAEDIDRLVRGLYGWPGSFVYFKGKILRILETLPLEEKIEGKPGEILEIKREGIKVCCGSNSLILIKTLQLEGRKALSAYEFSLGTKIKAGEILGE
ncbi:MAG: methionyl-tRNA formyltransferase [Candidatus Aminicenantia bacterium]